MNYKWKDKTVISTDIFSYIENPRVLAEKPRTFEFSRVVRSNV